MCSCSSGIRIMWFQWEPGQVITWLGIVLYTYEGSECMSVTERRIAKVKSHTDTILGRLDCMAVYARFFWPLW